MRTLEKARILTLNAGSTSIKLERYDLGLPLEGSAVPPRPAYRAHCLPDVMDQAIAAALDEETDVVAHRFVRLPDGTQPVIELGDALLATIAGVTSDAPLHDAVALRAVATVKKLRPTLRQFAVADGAFHRTMPGAATTYAIPRELTRSGLRRLGYHGLSHEYAAHRGCALAGLDIFRARVVTAHLGGGSSLCAILNGASIDTTMGYTPLEGIPMATRSGSVDPGLLLHLLRNGTTADELEEMLERRSGLLGISGRTGDVRELLAARSDPDARLAIDVLAWRLRAGLGAMIGVLGGLDLIVFTGGIGENAPEIRARGILGAAAAGVVLDDVANNSLSDEGRISGNESRAGAWVVRSREGWQLARAAFTALAKERRN